MNAAWQSVSGKLEALSLRERILVFAAVLGGIVLAVYVFAIEPAQQRQAAFRAQIARLEAELTALRQRPSEPRVAGEATQGERARAEEMKARIAGVEDAITALQERLVPAHRVRALLQQMLKAEKGVELVFLRSLPVVPLPVAGAATAAPAGAALNPAPSVDGGVYRHGVEVALRGSYVALHDYLKRLERAPEGMLWWRARLEADEEARLTLTLTLHTLSLDRAWLQL
jgi:MSHA biogenesis protein MshJ